jgi:hypothetical protein
VMGPHLRSAIMRIRPILLTLNAQLHGSDAYNPVTMSSTTPRQLDVSSCDVRLLSTSGVGGTMWRGDCGGNA